MLPDEVLNRIKTFCAEHAQSGVITALAHADLEDLNLEREGLIGTLGNMPKWAEEWVGEELDRTASSDAYRVFATKAFCWAEVWALVTFLNWLLWEVPDVVRAAVMEIDNDAT